MVSFEAQSPPLDKSRDLCSSAVPGVSCCVGARLYRHSQAEYLHIAIVTPVQHGTYSWQRPTYPISTELVVQREGKAACAMERPSVHSYIHVPRDENPGCKRLTGRTGQSPLLWHCQASDPLSDPFAAA